MELNPYVTFNGQAKEALTFYAKAFGTEIDFMLTYGEMPPQDWVTEENKHRVSHARIKVGNVFLMISDTAGHEPFEGHHGLALNVSVDDLDEASQLFATLSEGGTVSMPFEPTFWAKGFGVCRDKFGVGWMVNCEDANSS